MVGAFIMAHRGAAAVTARRLLSRTAVAAADRTAKRSGVGIPEWAQFRMFATGEHTKRIRIMMTLCSGHAVPFRILELPTAIASFCLSFLHGNLAHCAR